MERNVYLVVIVQNMDIV